jgi:raffinose/stachyose/melibiose transport system permease protein
VNEERIKLRNLRHNWVIFLMLAPTLLGVAVFRYTPAFEAVRHSFYNWDGAFREEFTGLDNFRKLIGDLGLWGPLLLAGACAGLAALQDGRRLRIALRGVALAAYALFFVRAVGDLQSVWNGGAVLEKSEFASSFITALVMLGVAAVCLGVSYAIPKGRRRSALRFFVFFLPFAAGITYIVFARRMGDWLLWTSFRLVFILVVANLFKMWPSIFTAVCIHRLRSDRWQYVYRVLFVVPMIIPHMVGLLIWKFFYDPNVGPLNRFLTVSGLDQVLIWFDKWVLHLGVFNEPFHPAWLADPDLIIPSLIFWGFPWVGVVGVLIYLAGLQNIGSDVYEAAEIDGVSWWGKFWKIELPLIMTQVRLNLVLMVIGTFQAYGFQLVLLGPEGGPENVGLTPGLYMFFQGFIEQNFGYACAIGLMLFFIILTLTIVNQRYVRVTK